MTRLDLTHGQHVGGDFRPFDLATGAMHPSPQGCVLAMVLSVGSGQNPAPEPAVSGLAVAWESVASVEFGVAGGPGRRLTCYWAKGTGAVPAQPGPLSMNFFDNPQQVVAWSVFEYDEFRGTTRPQVILQAKTADGSGTDLGLNLDPIADARDTTVTALALASAVPSVTAPGFTAIDDVEIANQPAGGADASLRTHDRSGQNTAAHWAWSGNTRAAAIAVEVNTNPAAVTPAPTPADRIRAFEPILFLHEQEKDVPSDPKRYLEHGALWKASNPRNKKDSWGGTGGPFPRAPLIARGGIAATQSEAGPGQSFLGEPGEAFITESPSETRFLQLAGWRDTAGASEPDVTSASSNEFADQQAVRDRYDSVDALRGSRFWYWAEHFDLDGLGSVSSEGTKKKNPRPDTSGVFSQLERPFALCYYLFFPTHEEALGGGCDSVLASQFRNFVGEWACVAVLASEDGDGTATPKFIGSTGRRPAPTGGTPDNPVYPPHAFDDSRRLVMKAAPWSDVTTNDGGDHPRLFVAKGTHGLYLEPGPESGRIEVDPYPVPSTNCGGYNPVTDTDYPVAWWVKVFLIPFGFLWALLEAAVEPIPDVAFVDPVAPDIVPSAGTTGTVIRPKGLQIPPGRNLTDWQADDVTLNSRTYGFVVDRPHQIWWPSLDNVTGFRGLWGQPVDPDPNNDREGMAFPDFCAMFLEAIAKIPG
ncbi:hypothetical protein ACFVUY_11390 [Kitasatospora sp. NPDC058063]|uniref:hypothetical protein n=1 Tax=unclassified Kitasatospora TaxID=2633591 RepID=UPI0036D76BCD